METKPANEGPAVAVLREILVELKEIREMLDAFTNGGFPLQQTIPSSELLSTLAVATGLLAKQDPRISHPDLTSRIEASPVIASAIIRSNDEFNSQNAPMRLSELLRGAVGG